mmetsp:Transcript_142/g.283  ORF Transcript_142/g.283 Transcript_142/m.283 type:complete len:519 (+) Transcript_142:127-1683(+)
MASVCEARKKDFKKGINAGDSRRRRGETSISLRKAKREEGLAKRRNININNFVSTDKSDEVQAKKKYTVADIPALKAGLSSNDVSMLIESTRGFRRILSVESNPPVEDVLASGVLTILVGFLGRNDSAELQFEAAWALTNIASTDRTSVVVENGACPFLIQLLTHSSADLREQCAWCLGNIAGDNTDFRDLILKNGGLPPLLMNIVQPASVSMLRNATWALSNFCRGKPQPDLHLIEPAINVLAELLKNQDQETVVDACWALSYLSDGDDARIQTVVDSGVIPTLVNLFANPSSSVITPSLRTLGNIVTGNDVQTQAVIDANILAHSPTLLRHPKKTIRKETCWMLSNIAAGTPPQISSLMNAPQVIPNAIQQLSCGEWDVRKEACWIISNVATGGAWEHVQQLVEQGCMKPVCDLLDVSDSKIILVALEAIEAMMKMGEKYNAHYEVIVDEAEGIEKIEQLQEHEVEEVYNKSVHILEEFFAADEDEDENLAPNAVENCTSFSFGVAAQQPQTTFSF